MIVRYRPPIAVPLFIAGLIHALSFAPGFLPAIVLSFMQLLSLTALFYYGLKNKSTKSALAGTWLFGIASFGLGVYWLYISMHTYGGMAPALAALAVLLFSAVMALYYVIAIALMRFALRQPHTLNWTQQLAGALLIASVWTLLEWVRGTFLTGFPWLNIAYAHVDSMFAGWAPLFGAYGVSWFAAFAAATLALFALNTHENAPKNYSYPLGIAVLFSALGIVLGGITWHQPHEDPFYVRLTQANIDQNIKFEPQGMQAGIDLYQKLTALSAKTPESTPDLIILPETIVPLFQHQWPPEFWQEWIDIAAAQDATLLLGVPLYAQNGDHPVYTNSAITIDAQSSATAIQRLQMAQRYDKHHLVPFGEFVPTGFQWFIDRMQIPLGNFNRGHIRQENFAINGQYIGPNICYEDVFGEEIIQSVRAHDEHGAGATLLVNISNLAWFGDTWALNQHLQIARMRSIETARPMLRATNTGATAVIFPNGDIQAQLPNHTVGVLDVEVQGTTGLTPYVRWGNAPVVLWSLLLAIAIGWRLRSASQSASS